MSQKSYLQRSSRFLIYAALQFIILTALAMLCYSGGNLFEKQASSYSFSHNFFSDLGGTVTYNGHENRLCLILFTIALCTVGLAMIAYSFSSKVYMNGRFRKLELLATVALLLTGVSFIFVALIPYNLHFTTHLLFVKIGFPLLLLYVVSILILQIKARWPRPYQIVNLVYLLLLGAYVLILFFGPKIGQTEGLQFQAIAQKVIVYASILLLGIQAYANLTVLKEKRAKRG